MECLLILEPKPTENQATAVWEARRVAVNEIAPPRERLRCVLGIGCDWNHSKHVGVCQQ
jgi:hypothetical protein